MGSIYSDMMNKDTIASNARSLIELHLGSFFSSKSRTFGSGVVSGFMLAILFPGFLETIRTLVYAIEVVFLCSIVLYILQKYSAQQATNSGGSAPRLMAQQAAYRSAGRIIEELDQPPQLVFASSGPSPLTGSNWQTESVADSDDTESITAPSISDDPYRVTVKLKEINAFADGKVSTVAESTSAEFDNAGLILKNSKKHIRIASNTIKSVLARLDSIVINTATSRLDPRGSGSR
ncbi:hypothetical protein CANCADRAFT_3927 [Tortispora caseinolytica NRRL Y-17796]|uniref:Uncharacterized protein n=1 Tax=Tortispora caseinolytica NRRL Y-17796 TaxID=767744 RepID=A0A1E4TC14_9ASCO|nr:hypothetical protein CANCADRAFT_3927 [Tortispora caseinolytica NRRL Y-17796]